MKSILSICFVAFVFLSACSSNSGNAQNTGNKIQSLSVDEFEKKLKETENLILVDVRTPGEYENGHLKNAKNININDENFEPSLTALDTNKPIFVYCLSGNRSMRAAKVMESMGFKTIYNMAGGFSAWNSAGKESEKGNSSSAGMSKKEFDKLVLHGDTLVFVDFNATWCLPCKKIHAYLAELEKEYAGKLLVVKIDYDKNMELAKEIKAGTVPFLYLMKGGIEQWSHAGFASKEEVKKEIDRILKKG
jgi:rhodanese-related sulfurtransferase